MKKLSSFLFAFFVISGLAFAESPSPADQKWLQAVEKMVAKGEKKVSTPNSDRVALLKEWAVKHGYQAKVTKTETGFAIQLAPKESAKTLAQQ